MVGQVPEWLDGFLTKSDLEQVERAVEEAEMKTSGEIVPMIVRSSSTLGHVPVILFFALLSILMFTPLPDHVGSFLGDLRFLTWLILIVGAAALATIGSRWSFLQRLLTTEADLLVQVERRAAVEFYERGLRSTKEGTGILIFLSLMEHKVVVLADRGIASKLPSDTWSQMVQLIVEGVKGRCLAANFSKAIATCGELLATDFPRQKDDVNELTDHLVIKE